MFGPLKIFQIVFCRGCLVTTMASALAPMLHPCALLCGKGVQCKYAFSQEFYSFLHYYVSLLDPVLSEIRVHFLSLRDLSSHACTAVVHDCTLFLYSLATSASSSLLDTPYPTPTPRTLSFQWRPGFFLTDAASPVSPMMTTPTTPAAPASPTAPPTA